jgi:hypothetical protein
VNLDPSKAILRVEARAVLMALPFRAYADLRYYLNGVAIQPSKDGGVNALATDGYTMACIRDAGGRCDDSTMILPIGKAQRSALRKGGHVLVGEDRRPWIVDIDGRVLWISPDELIEGKFPDVAKIVGDLADYQEGLVGTFNPEYIKRVREVFPTKAKYTGVRFFHRKVDGNLAQLCTLGPNGFALVMPMRDDRSEVILTRSVPTDFHQQAA